MNLEISISARFVCRLVSIFLALSFLATPGLQSAELVKSVDAKRQLKFKRATRWQATSVPVLNVDTKKMETFTAFTSTWGYDFFVGEQKTHDAYLKRVLVLVDSDGKTRWVGRQRDAYLKIGERIVGCYVHTNNIYRLGGGVDFCGDLGLDVRTYRKGETALDAPQSSKWDRFIHVSNEVRALHDGVYHPSEIGYHSMESRNITSWIITDSLPIELGSHESERFRCASGAVFNSHFIRNVFSKNGKICFEFQNTDTQNRGRLWFDKIDESFWVKKKRLKPMSVMDYIEVTIP
ncbi:MAG: hypothetical protein LBD14_06110 [Puniceicoccales bacterium]|jgi:hypothetical protein|nr:hypothetical protein [Puniceicoccales bacterium]